MCACARARISACARRAPDVLGTVSPRPPGPPCPRWACPSAWEPVRALRQAAPAACVGGSGRRRGCADHWRSARKTGALLGTFRPFVPVLGLRRGA